MKNDSTGACRQRRLGEVARILFSGVDKRISPDETPVRLCNYTDVYKNRRLSSDMAFSEGSATAREIASFQLRRGDVLITKDSEDPRDIAVPALVIENMPTVVCGYHLAVIRPDPDLLDGAFLAELLQHQPTRNYFARLANGVTRFGLPSSSLLKAPLWLPPIGQQKRIASLLYLWDAVLVKTQQLLKLKKRRKRGLMQGLLSGHRRFSEFARKSWLDVQVGDVLKEVNRTVRLRPTEQYRLVSIRRRSGGLFDRQVKFGSQIGYPVLERIHEGDFVIARRQVVHGAMAMVGPEFDGAFVSNAYAILAARDSASFHLPFFNYLSQQPYLYHAAFRCSYGVAIEKMFFRLDWFLREHIRIPPSVAEQRKIVAVLVEVDREIGLLERKVVLVRDQKKGLMQKLLTGGVCLSDFREKGAIS